jgi:hypothetical protein
MAPASTNSLKTDSTFGGHLGRPKRLFWAVYRTGLAPALDAMDVSI